MFQSVIQMPGFRSLGEGEEVEFEAKPSDKGVEATFVSSPGGGDCRGSDRRPLGKKKFKKIRWVSIYVILSWAQSCHLFQSLLGCWRENVSSTTLYT